MPLRHAVGLSLLACAALASCSNSPPPPPNTVIEAKLGPSRDAMNNNLCSLGNLKDVLTIGTFTGTLPTPQPNGGSQGGGVAVSCTVSGGFDVTLTAVLGGDLGGGSITIGTGHVDPSTGSQHIPGNLSTMVDGSFSGDCSIAFTFNGGAVPVQNGTPPIAGGRIWAHLSCPKMSNTSGQSVIIPSGQSQASVTEICDAEVDFLFQNCSM
jgi:hypothetical protein